MQKGDNDLMNRRSFLECLGITAIPCLLRAPDNKKEEIVPDKESKNLSNIVRCAYSKEIGRLFNTRVIVRW